MDAFSRLPENGVRNADLTMGGGEMQTSIAKEFGTLLCAHVHLEIWVAETIDGKPVWWPRKNVGCRCPDISQFDEAKNGDAENAERDNAEVKRFIQIQRRRILRRCRPFQLSLSHRSCYD